MRTTLLALLAVAAASEAVAQCDLIVRETFVLGERPHGGNGRPRDAFIHDNLSGYWPQLPLEAQWISGNQSGDAHWIFAASSIDPLEIDPADPFNGTSYGESPAAAMLPFTAPSGSLTFSAEAVVPTGIASAVYLGFTSSPITQSNFMSHGTLWISLDGFQNWALHANGAAIVASGHFEYSPYEGGWAHTEFTFDPATSIVRGRIGETPIPPVPVTLARPFAYAGMEANGYWAVVNNLSVFTGTPLEVTIQGPAQPPCEGTDVVLSASTNAAPPFGAFWRKDGYPVLDGPTPGGAVISGAQTTQLMISGVSPADAGQFECVVANACGPCQAAFTLTVQACAPCDPDVNCDGVPDQGDVACIILAVAGDNSCFCQADPDFNHDGVPDQGDVADLILAVAGAPCP